MNTLIRWELPPDSCEECWAFEKIRVRDNYTGICLITEKLSAKPCVIDGWKEPSCPLIETTVGTPGRWINTPEDLYKCSVCGYVHLTPSNFCPHCGAQINQKIPPIHKLLKEADNG